jgi:hypothetical protein
VVGGIEVFAVPAAKVGISGELRVCGVGKGVDSRGEDDCLADELAFGVFGDGNGIAAGAGSAADEGALGC